MILDARGGKPHATAAAIRQADFCLVPVVLSVIDIETAKTTAWALTDRPTPFAFVLNQCPAGGSTNRTSYIPPVLQIISTMVDMTLASRSDHLDVVGSGLGVTEHSLHGEASAEVNVLLDWVLPRLEKGIHPPSKLDDVRRPNA